MKALMLAATLALGSTSWAAIAVAQQQQTTTETPAPADAAQSDEDRWLRVFFELGSSRIGPQQTETLDRAARTFREGDPFVMVVTGTADTVGDPRKNLDLSLLRARAVADALTARGIPIERLQVLGRGNSELEVPTGEDVAEPENRIVEISWR